MIRKFYLLCLQGILVLGILMSSHNKFMVEIGFGNVSDLDELNKIGIDLDHHRTSSSVHAFVTKGEKNLIEGLGFSVSAIPNHARQYFEELKKCLLKSKRPSNYCRFSRLSNVS